MSSKKVDNHPEVSAQPPKVLLDRRTIAPILSLDFGIQVLNLESDLEKYPSAMTVHELVNLYSQAIEYYEYYKDPKHFDYENKLHTLLVRPDIISLVESDGIVRKRRMTIEFPAPSSKNYEAVKAQRKEESQAKDNALSEKLDKMIQAPEKAEKSLVRIENNRDKRDKEASSKIFSDFNSQDENLNRRLSSRKKLKENKKNLSRSRISSANSSDFDISDLISTGIDSVNSSMAIPASDNSKTERSELVSQYESLIEEILEKGCQEEALVISEIKIKYKNQLRVMEESGRIGKSVKDDMKEKVRAEVKNSIKILKEKRKEEIHQLKEKFRSQLS
ncbi:unnamed protein product [Blepharisma stoltei]|uniref:Uncharacterized protein n=1 Tax=Blepharisma stoltei TaxID=1481888 RepID=A0AAU9ITH0_9CILI|nr:unnamed protein product [Blepharisma stoltei]